MDARRQTGEPAEGVSLQLLIDSFVAITSERDVEAILERAVDLARLSTQARYGAAVSLEEGRIAVFVHAGLTKAQFEAMPHLPEGHGMLGAVLQEKAPIRLEHMQADQRSVGFPLGHVPMAAFLGVPIMFEDELRGALYLTKSPGQGTFGEQDEIFMLSLANQTAVAMETARLLDELRGKTAVVQLMQDIAVAANQAHSIDEAFQGALARICAYTGWPIGHAYVRAADGSDRLDSTAIWHLDDPDRLRRFVEATEAMPMPRGVGLPGRVLSSRRPAWIVDVTADANFPRAEAARACGLGGAFAFPVLVGTEIVAVLEFFIRGKSQPDEAILDIVWHVGTQLGRVVERARVEEETRRLDTSRSEFIANAAHELRTPLTTIAGFVDILTSRRSELEQTTFDEVLDALGRQADRARLLITSLLDLSQIEQGRLSVELKPIPIAGAVRRAVEAAPPGDGVEVVTDVPADLIALADLPRLDQILINMLSNAYRYGGGTIRIEGKRSGAEAVVSVSDEGPGVPRDLVPHLFEPFRRGSNVARIQGSGLGLAICRRLAEAFGGGISYEALSPRGARFSVRLRRPSAGSVGD